MARDDYRPGKEDCPMSKGQVDAMKSWQLAQAQTMIDLFTAAHARGPNSKQELCQFLEEEYAAGRIPAGPIQPTTAALLKIAKNGRLA